MSASHDPPGVHSDVTCPFCGLACDDLTVETRAGGIDVGVRCARAERGFRLAAGAGGGVRIGGRMADLASALARAAEILAAARQPLFAGMAADVAGTRALLRLAERCGAVVDHMNSRAKLRNLLAVQDSGWITTTLTEVRNRADVLLVVGTDVVSRFPRFFERVVWTGDGVTGLDAGSRHVTYLGDVDDVAPGRSPDGREPERIGCAPRDLPGVLAALHAIVAGRAPRSAGSGGVDPGALHALAQRLRAARYAVIVWAAPDLDHPHAELTVQRIAALIGLLNVEGRAAGLPLGGNDADITMNQVHTWQSGYPFRTDYGSGHPVYDPYHYDAARLLERGEADALVWVSSFDPERTPPSTGIPTVVLGHAAMRPAREPEVFLPVATPGVHHAGHFFRTDKVVALPLRAVMRSDLPAVGEIADGILAVLPQPQGASC